MSFLFLRPPAPPTMVVLSLILLVFFAVMPVHARAETPAVFGAKTFTLKNGLHGVVVENNRAPIVTHMLWIRAGAADEPESVGGIAHYLEHLMFKGTKQQEPGAYSRSIRALGGHDNAFTSQDYTAYFFTIAPEHLPAIMVMERERFLRLKPLQNHVKSELEVVIQERRERTDNDPLGALYEQVNAVLFAGGPYDNPVIGWRGDIEKLTWDDAATFKDTWYVPGNMTVIFSGDITLAAAQKLAQKYYGDFKVQPVPERRRLAPPRMPAQMTLSFTEGRIKQPQAMMVWRMPSYRQNPKTALALQVLAESLDGGISTPLYQNMIVRDQIATGVSLSYDPDAWDDTALWFAATPAGNLTPEKLAVKMNESLKAAMETLTEADIARTITKLKRQAIFARDSVSGPAMMIGGALMTGSTLDQIETWPDQIGAITLADVQAAANELIFCVPTAGLCQPPLTVLVNLPAGVKPDQGTTAPRLPSTGGHP